MNRDLEFSRSLEFKKRGDFTEPNGRGTTRRRDYMEREPYGGETIRRGTTRRKDYVDMRLLKK